MQNWWFVWKQKILVEEQIGFRTHHFLYILLSSYNIWERSIQLRQDLLYAAFINFRFTFDSILRIKLWDKLVNSMIDYYSWYTKNSMLKLILFHKGI